MIMVARGAKERWDRGVAINAAHPSDQRELANYQETTTIQRARSFPLLTKPEAETPTADCEVRPSSSVAFSLYYAQTLYPFAETTFLEP